MSWDPIWEDVFRSRPWGKYPPEELVRFVARNYFPAPDRGAVKILEVGCGPGANVWLLAREGFAAYGIDGSATAIELAERRLAAEALAADLRVGDIVDLAATYAGETFDAVVDVWCIACNRVAAIDRILDGIAQVLKPGGRVFSIVPSWDCYGAGLGSEVEPNTFTEISDGPLAGAGLNHFFSLEEAQALYGQFDDLHIESSRRTLENRSRTISQWIIDGVAPG